MGPGEAHAGMALVFLKPNVWLHLSPALRGDATQGRTPSTAPAARPGPAGAVGAARMQPPGWLQGEGCEGEAAARTAPCTWCCQNLSCLRRQQRAASSQPQASLLSSGRGAAIAEMVSYKKKKAPPFFFFFFCSASACGGGEARFRLRSAILHRKQHAPFPSSAKQQPGAKSSVPRELLPHGGPQPAAPGHGRTGAVGARAPRVGHSLTGSRAGGCS